jgi:hypothetical protein
MKMICYLALGSIYTLEASLGHGVVYVVLAIVYALLGYAEWSHSNHQQKDHKSGSKDRSEGERTGCGLG